MQLSSPQVREQQTMPANGKMYIAGRGGAVDANQIAHVHVHRDAASQHVAARRRARAGVPDSRRRRLVDDAWRWQAGRRRGIAGGSSKPGATGCSTSSPPWKRAAAGDHRSRAVRPRRRELVTALERVYAALDDEARFRARRSSPWRGLRQPHLHRRHPQFRPPPRAEPRVVDLPGRRARRAARAERRRQVHPALDRRDAPEAVVRAGALRRRSPRPEPAPRCAPASACWPRSLHLSGAVRRART